MSGTVSSALVKTSPRRVERLRAILPDVWALVGPRKWLLLGGFGLIAVQRITSLAPPYAMKYLIDDVIKKESRGILPWVMGALLGAAIVSAGTNYAITQLFSRSTMRLTAELRCKLEAHVMRLSLLYHDRNKSGALGSRVMNDVAGLQNLVGAGFIGYIGSLMTSCAALALMVRQSPSLAAGVLIGLLALAGAIAWGTSGQRKLALERNEILADVVGRLQESLGGVRVVKAYRAEERERVVFEDGMQRMIENQIRAINLSSGLGRTTALLWGVGSALLLWLGTDRILDGRLTLGQLVMIMGLLTFMVQPLMQLVGMGTQLMEVLAGLERTRALLLEPTEDDDPNRTVAAGPLEGDVIFEDVQFEYAAGKPVLRDVSFRAAPGTVTAFVGPSGSGKSTTTGLIASFYKPTLGRILVDGVDITTLRLPSYRAQLGVVLQETFLFAGSILENVAFARPEATREEILAACRTARVDEFAEKLDKQYDTPIGERGVLLSGGQRQRISIARALLADPRILILDEATSSLDSHSEALIQEALSHLLKGRTTFVIAHRLSTIRAADQILVVDSGRVVERGTHDELCAARGKYFDMYDKQHRVDTDLFLAPGEGEALPEARRRLALPAASVEDAAQSLGIPVGLP